MIINNVKYDIITAVPITESVIKVVLVSPLGEFRYEYLSCIKKDQ